VLVLELRKIQLFTIEFLVTEHLSSPSKCRAKLCEYIYLTLSVTQFWRHRVLICTRTAVFLIREGSELTRDEVYSMGMLSSHYHRNSGATYYNMLILAHLSFRHNSSNDSERHGKASGVMQVVC